MAESETAGSLQSMTGFARAQTEGELAAISWELRSVNGRGLEVRLRTPNGFEWADAPSRQAIQKAFSRGNIQANLVVTRNAAISAPVVNEAFLKDVAGLAKRLEDQFDCRPATADGLLALKGVLDLPDAVLSDDDREALQKLIADALKDALSALKTARLEEGRALSSILQDKLDTLQELTRKAEADESRSPEAIRERLKAQIALIMESSSAVDEARLAQEAAVLATKADIREELDRLKTHIASADQLLSDGGPVGRKLDFISQEFNREANTLCSKSNAAAITAIGLEMKVVIDQFREQVQNLE